MNKFLVKILIFISIPLSIILTIYIKEYKYIPAPKITSSYSFNEKMFFKNDLSCDFLAIGSSMTLNNLNSDVIFREIVGTKKIFLNMSSWGMTIKDDYIFLKEYLKIYNPEAILLNINVMDFYKSQINLEEFQFSNCFINSRFNVKPFLYLINPDLEYYITYYNENKINKAQQNIYTSLLFDSYGSILINKTNFKIDKNRWDLKFQFNEIINDNFKYLDSISYLNNNLILCLSPIRNGIIDSNYIDNISIFVEKLNQKAKQNNFIFINSTNENWNDSLFIDSSHFNSIGSKLYSEFICNKIKSSQIFLHQ